MNEALPRPYFYFAAPEFRRERPRDIGSWYAGNVAVDKYPRGESHKSTGYTTSENQGHHWCLKISDVSIGATR